MELDLQGSDIRGLVVFRISGIVQLLSHWVLLMKETEDCEAGGGGFACTEVMDIKSKVLQYLS